MRKRAILLLAALSAAVVIAIALVRWKSIVVRFQVFRLSGKPALQDAWLERPVDSIEGRAARTYFGERPAELVRKFLRTVRLVCERSGRPPPAALKDFEGQDRVEIHLGLERTGTEEQLVPRMISFRFERKDREGGTGDGVFPNDAESIGSLRHLADLLRGSGDGRTALPEYPAWTFDTFIREDEKMVLVGIRAQWGEPTRAEDEIGGGVPEIWTGREILLLGWRNGAALDPLTGKWRPIPGMPTDSRSETRAVILSDREVLIASMAPQGVAFYLYRMDRNSWERIGETSPPASAHSRKDSAAAELSLMGGTALGGEAIFFMKSGGPGAPALGVRIDPSGSASWISAGNAPPAVLPAIYSFGNRVFYWGFVGPERNAGAIWDGHADRWEPMPEGGPGSESRCFFGHFRTDDEVIIVGGSDGRLSKDLDDAIAFSMAGRSWRKVALPPGVGGKQNPAVGWTGREAWIWEGRHGPGIGEGGAGSAGLLDLRTGTWKPFPSGGPSPRCSPFSAWTGKEILFLGGQDDRGFLRDAWAFNPSTAAWRRLDSIPRSRQECAGQ